MKRSTTPLLAAALLGLAGAASAQTVLKIGYATSKESHYGVGANTFCDEIAKGTANRYSCQQFPNSALGGEREMIEAVQLGTLDLVNTSTGPLGNFVPEVKIVDIPFLLRDYDHARHVMDGPIGQEMLKKMQAKGLVGIAWNALRYRERARERARALLTAQRDERRIVEVLAMSERLDAMTEREIIQEGLEAAVRLTDSKIGFFHFVNEDQNSIELVTWSKDTIASYCHAAYDTHYPIERAGVWADCARLHQPVLLVHLPQVEAVHGGRHARRIAVPV